ncbi:MAG TPA: hypothetical protein VMU66_04910, partial [Gaiellales bacterium]|nr:hypothetical protein [Gaiellales bacterium]
MSGTVDTNAGDAGVVGDQGDVPGGRPLTEAEWAALRSLRHRHGARWRDARHRALIPLFRPVRAMLAQSGCRHGSVVRAVCWQLLGDLEQRGVTFAAWSAAAWQDTIARTEPLGRAYVTVVAYQLGGLPGEYALVTGGRVRLVAERLFGVAAVQAALDQARAVLDGWGYDRKPTARGYLDRVLCQALVLARSPQLAAIAPAHLATLCTLNRGRKRSCVVLLGRVLVALGLLPEDHARLPAPATPGADAVGVAPEWYAWCRRWRAQSAQRDVRAMYGSLLQAGRWLAVAFPAVTAPMAWTQEIAVAFVAAVNAKRTGEWTRTWATNNRARAGTPLRPASKAGLLSALRTFFRDGQE